MAYRHYGWTRYVPVAERRAKAQREMQKRKKKGQTISPVELEGRTIARTFWGKAWCDNLENYSDYSNRMPRGRTYVRNGSVVDLQIAPGRVEAMVSGSSLYTVTIGITPLPAGQWASIREDCAGAIDSLVELLQGRLSKGVMERISRQRTGLFPSPAQIKLSCSCPDWAIMCKHVAAALYGVGARLDHQPELLFRLRGVDETELVAEASRSLPLTGPSAASERVLESDDLADLFGLDMDESAAGATSSEESGATSSEEAEALSEDEQEMLDAIAAVEARAAELRVQIARGGAGTNLSRMVLARLEEWLGSRQGALTQARAERER